MGPAWTRVIRSCESSRMPARSFISTNSVALASWTTLGNCSYRPRCGAKFHGIVLRCSGRARRSGKSCSPRAPTEPGRPGASVESARGGAGCVVRGSGAPTSDVPDRRCGGPVGCANLGIAAHGTIGVLFCAIRQGRRTGREVAALLRSLPAVSSLHVRRSLLEEFIQQAEQAP